MRALLSLLLVTGCAGSRLHAADIAGEAAFGVVLAMDYVQTEQITADGWEHNPIIGQRGQRVPPAIYFPISFVLHAAVAWALPRPFRNAWQAGWTVAEGVVVWNNAVSGYGP